MNWARAKSRPRAPANDRAASVLPRPGKSSSRTWPLARMPASTRVSASRLPTTARPTSSRTRSANVRDGRVGAGVSCGHGTSSIRVRMRSISVGAEPAYGVELAVEGLGEAGSRARASETSRSRTAARARWPAVAGQDAQVGGRLVDPVAVRRQGGQPPRRVARRRCRCTSHTSVSTMVTMTAYADGCGSRSSRTAADEAGDAEQDAREEAAAPHRARSCSRLMCVPPGCAGSRPGPRGPRAGGPR